MSDSYFQLWAQSALGRGPERYAAGQTIFTLGDAGEHMYIVRSGAVDLSIGDKVVETVEANGIFGELALVDGQVRSATARARESCELAPIDKKTFVLMVDEAPHFALNVMRVMANRLRRMTK
jgi:CRP/FNR family transcriptional regulator, cyclic AMP receptor protein